MPSHDRQLERYPADARGAEGRLLYNAKGICLLDTFRHYMQFEKNGERFVQGRHVHLYQIHTNVQAKVGAFSSGQKQFLAYHRENVFLSRRTA